MKVAVLFSCWFFICGAAAGQSLPTWKPDITSDVIEYTPRQQRAWERLIRLNERLQKGVLDEADLYTNERDSIELLVGALQGPLVEGISDSWYNVGGPYLVEASTFLEASRTTEYTAEQAHDFSLLSGWAEGNPGLGLGSEIRFYFKPFSPRVNQVTIYNGYFKNKLLWNANARAKKIKLSVNGRPLAYLALVDRPVAQTFSFEPLQSKVEGQDLILAFELVEAYPGEQYEDVVISEFHFDGLDVLCFSGDTPVRLADGSEKPIKAIAVGDRLQVIDPSTGKTLTDEVLGVEMALHRQLVTYEFTDGYQLTATPDHPIWCPQKGWVALQPERSLQYEGYTDVKAFELGDSVWQYATDGTPTVRTLKAIRWTIADGPTQTYTITKMQNGTTFLANGIIVGTEGLEY